MLSLWFLVMVHLQAKKMAAAGAKEDTFDIWMKQESDTVQALGMAYAERETIEACYRVIQEVSHPVLPCAACA